MQKGREIKLPEILATLIEAKGYTGAQKEVSLGVGVTPSALTQYLRGRTRPSFDVLIKLADFFEVSLDYLVFGEQETESRSIDYGPLARYIDTTLANLQARSDQRTWMFSRIAQELATQIDLVAKGLLEAGISQLPAGLLKEEETMKLEECSLETNIISMNLYYDIIQTATESEIAGRFLAIVGNNLSKERSYKFLLPYSSGRDWKPAVESYITLLQRHTGSDRLVIDKCKFRRTERPLISGCGLYRLDVPEFSTKYPFCMSKFVLPSRKVVGSGMSYRRLQSRKWML